MGSADAGGLYGGCAGCGVRVMLPFPAGARLSPLGNASSRGSRPSTLQPPAQSKGQAGQGPPHPAANYPCRPLLDGGVMRGWEHSGKSAWPGPHACLCVLPQRRLLGRPESVLLVFPAHGLAGRAAPGPGSGRRSGDLGGKRGGRSLNLERGSGSARDHLSRAPFLGRK